MIACDSDDYDFKEDDDMPEMEVKSFQDGLHYVIRDLKKLMISKQRDYGHKNITEMGVMGLIVRINDKLARLKNLHGFTDKSYKIKATQNESIKDTWCDIANYCIIALMIEEGTFILPLLEDMKNVGQQNAG